MVGLALVLGLLHFDGVQLHFRRPAFVLSINSGRVKNDRYLGQYQCLTAGQLDPNERTRDDAGAI